MVAAKAEAEELADELVEEQVEQQAEEGQAKAILGYHTRTLQVGCFVVRRVMMIWVTDFLFSAIEQEES